MLPLLRRRRHMCEVWNVGSRIWWLPLVRGCRTRFIPISAKVIIVRSGLEFNFFEAAKAQFFPIGWRFFSTVGHGFKAIIMNHMKLRTDLMGFGI